MEGETLPYWECRVGQTKHGLRQLSDVDAPGHAPSKDRSWLWPPISGGATRVSFHNSAIAKEVQINWYTKYCRSLDQKWAQCNFALVMYSMFLVNVRSTLNVRLWRSLTSNWGWPNHQYSSSQAHSLQFTGTVLTVYVFNFREPNSESSYPLCKG